MKFWSKPNENIVLGKKWLYVQGHIKIQGTILSRFQVLKIIDIYFERKS